MALSKSIKHFTGRYGTKARWWLFKLYRNAFGTPTRNLKVLVTHAEMESYINGPNGGKCIRMFDLAYDPQSPQKTVGTAQPCAELEIHPTFSTEFICIVKDARVYQWKAFIVLEKKWLINQISHSPASIARDHKIYTYTKLPLVRHLKGRAMLMQSTNWYHFIYECLPQLYLLRRIGINWSKIDWFVFRGFYNQNIESCLKAYDIPVDKLMFLSNEYHNYSFDELMLSTYFDHWGSWVKDVFKPISKKYLFKQEKNLSRRIYSSRAFDSCRRIKNEVEFIHLLHQYKFLVVHNASITLEEQIALFAEAEFVIGPHGANLANIVFCKPGTVLSEIRYSGHCHYIKKCYWQLSLNMDMKYHLFYSDIGYPITLPDGSLDHVNSDIYVDIEKMKEYLEVNLL